jgi:hypothetical protein
LNRNPGKISRKRHNVEFKAGVALEATRGEQTLADSETSLMLMRVIDE